MSNKKSYTYKYFRFIEYVYLLFAIIMSAEAYRVWGTNRDRALMLSLLVVVALFMFFFKRRFRKKFQQRQTSDRS
ncbi:MAG: hypothetical protein RQ756_09240 [Flavobacteriaceae bacterium]|nr:hypothetical protein [Flavobacteriaceae bacterium]